MSGTSRLFQRFLSLFGPKMLSTIIAIVSTPIIVRLLGPGGYGDYAVLLSIYSLYMIPISSAITEGVQKFVAEDERHDAWLERVIQFYFLLALVLVLLGVTILLIFVGLGLAEQFFDEEFTFYFYLLAAFVFVGQFRGLTMHTILGFGLEHINGPLGVLKKVLITGVGILLVLAGLDVTGMVLGNIIAELTVAVIAGYVILNRISVRQLFQIPDSVPVREFLSFNVLNVLLVLLVMSLFHIDIVMVRTLVGDEATGYYRAALALAEYLWIVPIVLQTLLLHSTASLWSEGKTDEITEISGRITRYNVLLVLVMAIGMAALAHRLVPLYYGADFVVATIPLLLLLPGAIGFAVARPLQAICQGSGDLRPLITAVAIAATLNVVLNATLIPLYGMNGAAVATSTSYGSMFVLLIWASWRIGYNPLSDFRPGRVAATAVIAGIPIFVMGQVIPGDILSLVVVPILGLAIFTVTAVVTGALEKEELNELLGKLPAPFDKAAAF